MKGHRCARILSGAHANGWLTDESFLAYDVVRVWRLVLDTWGYDVAFKVISGSDYPYGFEVTPEY